MTFESNIRLVVGLGNPGNEYIGTRHNIGADVLDVFISRLNLTWSFDKKLNASLIKVLLHGSAVLIAKPATFMNESGVSVGKICDFFKLLPAEVLIVCDDITIDVGSVKLVASEGTAGHNGVADIEKRIGKGFSRYRIGVGCKVNKQMDLKDHVLGKFSADEKNVLDSNLNNLIEDLNLVLDKGVEYAMNLINRKNRNGKQEI